jgi:hypothetical protein
VEELALLGNKTGATRLGFAVLLKFFQKEARFPAYKNEVPGAVIAYLATQARVPAKAYLQYDWQGRSIMEHRADPQGVGISGSDRCRWRGGQSLAVSKKLTTRRAEVKHFIEFPLEDGETIVVEVDEPEERGSRRVARGTEEEPEKASQTFEQALRKIRPATEKVITTLRDLIQKPAEIEMEFGFSLSAGTGVIIASASTQANYRVTLRWKGETKESNS